MILCLYNGKNNIYIEYMTKYHKKHKGKKPYKKTHRKKHSKNTNVVVIKSTHHMPIAPKLKVCFEQDIQGYASTGGSVEIFGHSLNFITTPARFSAAPTSLPNPIGNSQYPPGYQQYLDPDNSLGRALYSYLTVYGVECTLTITPQAVLDLSYAAMAPILCATSGSIPQSYPNALSVIEAPWGKGHMVSSNNMLGNNTIRSYIDIAKYLGISKEKLFDDPRYSSYRVQNEIESGNTLTPPTEQVCMFMIIQSADGTNLTTNCIINAKFKYYCQLSQPMTGNGLGI